jgi:hypothetical protein
MMKSHIFTYLFTTQTHKLVFREKKKRRKEEEKKREKERERERKKTF